MCVCGGGGIEERGWGGGKKVGPYFIKNHFYGKFG